MNIRRFPKYKQNCGVITNGQDYILSYDTQVALIDYATKTATPLGWWSVTTSKHINYVASMLGLTVVKK